jgi:hypothetical protein
MIINDLLWRGSGLIALGVAALSGLMHRAVLEAHSQGPASAWELVLGLTSFAAASLGVLLLLHGRRLFRDDAQTLTSKAAVSDHFSDSRCAMAAMLADKAIARARQRRP